MEDEVKGKHLQVGIIGLGVGEAHLRSYQQIKDVTVKSICDIDPVRLHQIGDKYGVEQRFEDYRKITEDPDIGVVSICSYDNFHAEQLKAAIRNEKHVMIEKPAVLQPKEAEQVIRLLSEYKVKITSNLILRSSPRFKKIKELIDNGDFGEIFHIEGDYLHQILWKITEGWRGKMDFYCTVYGGGVHLIDLMRWLMGQEIACVSAMGTGIPSKQTQYKWPDTITSLFQWESGATGKSTTSFAPKRTKFHSLNVYGTKKSFTNFMPDGQLFSGDQEQDIEVVQEQYPGFEKGDLLPQFIHCIREDQRPDVNEIDIFRVMAVCFAIWESVVEQRHVQVTNII